MGRINVIWSPLDWKINFVGNNKIIHDDIIYKMVIGEGEDCCYYEITEFISKDNYEKIINNDYNVMVFPYSFYPILLFDNKQLIPLVKGTKVLFDKLDSVQQDIVLKMRNERIQYLKQKKYLTMEEKGELISLGEDVPICVSKKQNRNEKDVVKHYSVYIKKKLKL